MEATTFFFAWIIAVALMTSFSALWSFLTRNEFREHILLSHLYTKGHIPNFTVKQRLIGWGIHYGLGLVFLGGYEILWQLTNTDRSIVWSLIFGMFSGVLGILGWIIMFKLHKDPPRIHFTQYYIQLFCAHLVFSLSAYSVYSLFN